MKLSGLGVAGLVAMTMSFDAVAQWPEMEFGGLVEVEASSSEDFAGAKTSDITLATVALGIDARVNERVSAHISFLYEEDATDFGVDEGTLSFLVNDVVSFSAGKMYVPFGRYDSFMVSDPQTLVMGETVETVLMVSAERNGLYGSVYTFNGDSDKASTLAKGNDNELSAGFNLGYARDEGFDVGISYISNIGDTDTLQALEASPTAGSVGQVDSPVPGGAAHVMVSFGNVTLVAEHVRALEKFTNGDLDGTVTAQEQPAATNFEAGIQLEKGWLLAAAYQETSDALFIGLPKKVVSGAVSYEVMPGATVAVEYASMEDYASNDGGTGESANTLTLKMAAEF